MALKAKKVAVVEEAPAKAPAKAPVKAAPAFSRYQTPKDQTGRLLIAGFRPTMPQIPGPCFYKVPAADVAAFEKTKEFQGGIVVRVD